LPEWPPGCEFAAGAAGFLGESNVKFTLPATLAFSIAMLIIINDDAVYVSWISRHRTGFVVDCRRKPTKDHLILHRATCWPAPRKLIHVV
jgi:hypothetical protein